jgi:hypothetical protein
MNDGNDFEKVWSSENLPKSYFLLKDSISTMYKPEYSVVPM